MFNLKLDQKLESWYRFRIQLNDSKDPLSDVWEYWRPAPFIPHNQKIDPYYQRGWPTPWEIISDNKYDDFTKALMIGWTLKLTERYKNSLIELKILEDSLYRLYNVIYVDNAWVINYSDLGPVTADSIPGSFKVQNQIELAAPR